MNASMALRRITNFLVSFGLRGPQAGWDKASDPLGDRIKFLRGDQSSEASTTYSKVAGASPTDANDLTTKGYVDAQHALRGAVVFSVGRDANASGIWLYGADRIPCNEAPFRVPFDATVVAITATTNGNRTCDFELYRNSDVRAGGTPSDANKLAELVFSAQQSGTLVTSVNVNAGDELGVYMRGSNVNRPRCDVFLVRR